MGGGPFKGFRNQGRYGTPAPPAVAADRFGRPIEPGHLVMFHNEGDLVFEVVDVRPILDPNVPPGQRVMQVLLTAQFPVQLLGGQPNRLFAVVGETQARLQGKAAQNGQGPMPVESEQPEPEPAPGIVLTDLPSTVTDEQLADAASPIGVLRESGKPCGCDPAANHVCERHQAEPAGE